MPVFRLIMTYCINKDQPDWDLLALCTRQGFSIQSDFYLAQDREIGCETVGASLGGSIPLAPVQGIYHPKSMAPCSELLVM